MLAPRRSRFFTVRWTCSCRLPGRCLAWTSDWGCRLPAGKRGDDNFPGHRARQDARQAPVSLLDAEQKGSRHLLWQRAGSGHTPSPALLELSRERCTRGAPQWAALPFQVLAGRPRLRIRGLGSLEGSNQLKLGNNQECFHNPGKGTHFPALPLTHLRHSSSRALPFRTSSGCEQRQAHFSKTQNLSPATAGSHLLPAAGAPEESPGST